MCGFIACKKEGKGTNRFISRRGEDMTTMEEMNGYIFIHNLLHITGEPNPQPFIDGNIVCVYNGEIYNHPFQKSDGEVLIPLYKQFGTNFVKELDGEFAIALFDFDNKIEIFSTDAFRTKPIWVNSYGAASYRSGLLNPSGQLPVNSYMVRDMDTGIHKISKVHEFDFDHEEKTNYNHWIYAFEDAVQKRATKPCFIGLSSGYDSGAIHCALKNIGADFKAYSIRGVENDDILLQRNEVLPFSEDDYRNELSYIIKEAEDYDYKYFNFLGSVKTDSASIGMGHIFRNAKKEGYRIYLSGQGSDEIIADYGKWASQSDFKGKFPTPLRPWTNFYHGCQEAYLAKEEHIAGAYSIEGRYPFLDKYVVQEFLWLTNELKNKHYKAPLHEYLTRNNYPFAEGEKIGFVANERLTG